MDSMDDLNIDALLLSYELDKLNLDSIPNDFFELQDEVSKNDEDSDIENDLLPGDNKIIETDDSKCFVAETSTKKVCKIEVKVEASRNSKRKKDINGNEEPLTDGNEEPSTDGNEEPSTDGNEKPSTDGNEKPSTDGNEESSTYKNEEFSTDESLNQLFVKLELSDSDNEEADDEDSSKLRERGPQRSIRRANRNKERSNIFSRHEAFDRSQFNSERLKFLSGSNQIQLNDSSIFNQFVSHNNVTSSFSGNKPANTLSIQESFYEDARANSVSSPESGYDSSTQSIAGSPPPPPISTSLSLDFIPETVDEQNILDFLAENSDGALIDNNSISITDEKDDEGKITEIINFLKATPAEFYDSSSATALSDNNTINHVPLASHSEDLNTSSVQLSPVPSNSVLKGVEAQKKLVYKLDNKAKTALREFLSKDEFYAVKQRIYKRINEDRANNREIKVIFVEDEADKASENRTNLHYAVLNSKIEDIYCLVEIHKQYNKPFTDINIRDKHGKTALDYAIQNQMTLVVDYLKENTACQSVNV